MEIQMRHCACIISLATFGSIKDGLPSCLFFVCVLEWKLQDKQNNKIQHFFVKYRHVILNLNFIYC